MRRSHNRRKGEETGVIKWVSRNGTDTARWAGSPGMIILSLILAKAITRNESHERKRARQHTLQHY